MITNKTYPSKIIEELAGLAHLFEPVPQTEPVSFEMESLQRLLSATTLYHRDLSTLIYEIADLGKLSEEWKAVFELAYEKIPLNKRIYARDAMMYLYRAFGDREMARKFLPLKPYTPWEIRVAKWVKKRKARPVRAPHTPPRDPAAQVSALLASLEKEQHIRFKSEGPSEQPRPGQ